MAPFPILISLGIAALFLGAIAKDGSVSTRRLMLGYFQLLLWWPLVVWYYKDLLDIDPERKVVVSNLYHSTVTFLLPVAMLAVYSVAAWYSKLPVFFRRFACFVGCLLTLNWFFLAIELPARAPEHDFVIGFADMRGFAAANGIALALAALALAWHAINPSWGSSARVMKDGPKNSDI